MIFKFIKGTAFMGNCFKRIYRGGNWSCDKRCVIFMNDIKRVDWYIQSAILHYLFGGHKVNLFWIYKLLSAQYRMNPLMTDIKHDILVQSRWPLSKSQRP